MKRTWALILIFTLVLGLSGCGDDTRIRELEERIAVLEYRIGQLEQGASLPQMPEQAQPDAMEQPMDAWDPQSLKTTISTMEEAIAHLDERFPELWMSAHLTDGVVDYWWLASGEEVLQRQSFESVGRSCIVNAVTYLLCDDMQIHTLIGFRHNEQGGIPMMAINCIKTPSGYEFIDPVRRMRGDAMSRNGALLPEARTATLEEYVDLAISDAEIYDTLDYLYLFEGGTGFEFYEDPSGLVTLRAPEVEPLYKNGDRILAQEELNKLRTAHIKPENIGSYQLSQVLGGTTLTADQAYGLVDADPETVKEQVKTAADMLMYMLAAQIGDNGGCYCDDWGGWTWHSNFTAKDVMERGLSNCGASANLANYLLEGDYPEVGIINHAYYPGNGGGHVYNYFLFEDHYYIVDFSWYIFGNYSPSNDFPVMKLNSLEEFGSRVSQLYSGVSLVIAYTSPGQHLPNIFGEQYGDLHYYVPQGARYTVLFEAGDGYLIGEKPLDKKYHDWTKFW